jgi:hypothetical protein
LREYAGLVGDDHSVGICNCDILRSVAAIRRLAGAKVQSTSDTKENP